MKLYNLICIIRLSKDLPRAPDMEIRHDDVEFAHAHHAMTFPLEYHESILKANLTEATGVTNQMKALERNKV